jgi:tetratricopeptide (TPR) repeat protein
MGIQYLVYEDIEDLKYVYEYLMRTTCLASFSNEQAISYLGALDDMSHSCQRIEGLKRADILAKEILKRNLSEPELSKMYYCWANIWADMRKIRSTSIEDHWKWDQEELEKEIIYLRSSLKHNKGNEHNDDRIADKLTNLGNHLNSVGRFFEALDCWNKALEYDNKFGMARGNRGYGTLYFSGLLFDMGHREKYIKHAYQDIQKALCLELNPDFRSDLMSHRKNVEKMYPKDFLQSAFDFKEFSLGDTEDEILYRKWCLSNKLFINPMNDLFVHSISARDVLHLPSMIVKTGQRPPWQSFVNQIKQEYVTARFLLYEGIHKADTHFSDKNTALVDPMDGSEYSKNIENIKMTFKTAYSLFDKIACFMNEYMQLGISRKGVYLSRLWYTKRNKKVVLRNEFEKRVNLPFRGLFWLSKDLYEYASVQNDSEPKFPIDPEAKELSTIRNHIEHKAFLVINDYWGVSQNRNRGYDESDFLYRITRSDFTEKILNILKKARAALMYMLLGIWIEEVDRKKEIDDSKVLKIESMLIDDDRKQ